MARLVDANVSWHRPPGLRVDETADIGLAVGEGERLRQQIDSNLPDTVPTSAGTVRVGPDVQAVLIANPADASIEPDQAINASTGSEIGLLWTWKVHPLHPTDALRLTARLTVDVPGTDHVLVHNVPLTLRVERTASFTAGQVFSTWETWAGIGTAAVAVVGWWLRRRSSGRSTATRKAAGGSGPRRTPRQPARGARRTAPRNRQPRKPEDQEERSPRKR